MFHSLLLGQQAPNLLVEVKGYRVWPHMNYLLRRVVGVWLIDQGAIQSLGWGWRRHWRWNWHILVGVSSRRDGVGGLFRQEYWALWDVGCGWFQVCQQRVWKDMMFLFEWGGGGTQCGVMRWTDNGGDNMSQFLIPMCHQKKISPRHASSSIKVRPSQHRRVEKYITTHIAKPFIKFPPESPNILFPSVHTINTSLLTMTSTCQSVQTVIRVRHISVLCTCLWLAPAWWEPLWTDRNKEAERADSASECCPGLRGHGVALLGVGRNAGTK